MPEHRELVLVGDLTKELTKRFLILLPLMDSSKTQSCEVCKNACFEGRVISSKTVNGETTSVQGKVMGLGQGGRSRRRKRQASQLSLWTLGGEGKTSRNPRSSCVYVIISQFGGGSLFFRERKREH